MGLIQRGLVRAKDVDLGSVQVLETEKKRVSKASWEKSLRKELNNAKPPPGRKVSSDGDFMQFTHPLFLPETSAITAFNS